MEKLDSVSFDILLEQQRPFDSAHGLFDLSGIKLITPAAMVQLASACYALNQRGCRPVIKVDDVSVRSYLRRSAFLNVVQAVAQIEPQVPFSPYDHRSGLNPMLIEVTKIETGAALPALLNQIVWVLRHRLKYRKYDAFDVTTAISEICQNTFDHNAPTCGFIAMQVYGGGARRFLEIGVADYGDRLAATLRRNTKNPSMLADLEAIRLATKLGTSEYDDPTRGTGLYHLLEITYKHEGLVQIRSGSAKMRYRMDKKAGWAFRVAAMPGVQVALSLPSKMSG